MPTPAIDDMEKCNLQPIDWIQEGHEVLDLNHRELFQVLACLYVSPFEIKAPGMSRRVDTDIA